MMEIDVWTIAVDSVPDAIAEQEVFGWIDSANYLISIGSWRR